MRKDSIRLVLHRETLRQLERPELQRAAGQRIATATIGCSCHTFCSADSCPAGGC